MIPVLYVYTTQLMHWRGAGEHVGKLEYIDILFHTPYSASPSTSLCTTVPSPFTHRALGPMFFRSPTNQLVFAALYSISSFPAQ